MEGAGAQISNMNSILALFMRSILLFTVLLGLAACALLAGCTSPTQAEIRPAAVTAGPAPATPPTPAATAVSLPVAVETLPVEQYVSLELSKERPDSTIHLLYNGGKGEIFVQNVMMRVTRSDGQVTEQYLNGGSRKPQRGDELVMQGTRGSDRAEVFVTSAGRTYKIIDTPLALPNM